MSRFTLCSCSTVTDKPLSKDAGTETGAIILLPLCPCFQQGALHTYKYADSCSASSHRGLLDNAVSGHRPGGCPQQGGMLTGLLNYRKIHYSSKQASSPSMSCPLNHPLSPPFYSSSLPDFIPILSSL